MSENPTDSEDDHSAQALMYQWAARISVIAFEMVLPAVIGVGLDRLFGTVVLFAIFGVALGMALGFWQLIKIAGSQQPQSCDEGK